MPDSVLKILIEADSSGLTSQLSVAQRSILSFVDQMNDQQIGWEKILSGALDPAIITGVASMFANALIQYTSFQQSAMNLNNVGTDATNSFADSVGSMNGQVYQLAQGAGVSLGDATSAFEAFSKAGLDASAATYATNEAAQIAYDTGESLSSVVGELVPLFQNWGVTTMPQVNAALTGLVNAAQNGNFSFDQLVQTISVQGGNLSQKTDISDVAVDLATLSTQSGLTQSAIISSFNAISTAAVSGLQDPMNILVGNMSNMITTGPNGLITAFAAVGSYLNKAGPALANTFGQQMGLMTADVGSFLNTTQTGFTNAGTAADTLRSHLTPLEADLQAHESSVVQLEKSWNVLLDTLAAWAIPAWIPALTDTLNTWNEIFSSKSFTDALGDIGDMFSGAAGAANTELSVGDYQTVAGVKVPDASVSTGQLADLETISATLKQIAPSLTSSQLQSIGNSAKSSNLEDQIMTALNDAQRAPISTKSGDYAVLNSTFNINAPAGATSLTADQIATALYKQFHGN